MRRYHATGQDMYCYEEPLPELETFRKRLRILRRLHDLTQEELTEKAQIGRGSLRHYESGRRLPSVLNLIRLVKVLGSPRYLFGLAELPDPVPGPADERGAA